MKKKVSRSEAIPEYGSSLRNTLVSFVTKLPGYEEGLKKGFPLFTDKELTDIKERYKDGLTWEEIDKELSGKGLFFKKATFRKYIQDGNISAAIDYKNTENGRVAIFPADTISHINFIQYYYKVMDGEHIDNIIKIIQPIVTEKISYFEAIESNLEAYDNIYASIFHRLTGGDGNIDVAIEKTLKCRPDDRDKLLKMLDDIDDKFERTIRKDIDKFVSMLKKKYLTVLETIDIKETQNE